VRAAAKKKSSQYLRDSVRDDTRSANQNVGSLRQRRRRFNQLAGVSNAALTTENVTAFVAKNPAVRSWQLTRDGLRVSIVSEWQQNLLHASRPSPVVVDATYNASNATTMRLWQAVVRLPSMLNVFVPIFAAFVDGESDDEFEWIFSELFDVFGVPGERGILGFTMDFSDAQRRGYERAYASRCPPQLSKDDALLHVRFCWFHFMNGINKLGHRGRSTQDAVAAAQHLQQIGIAGGFGTREFVDATAQLETHLRGTCAAKTFDGWISWWKHGSRGVHWRCTFDVGGDSVRGRLESTSNAVESQHRVVKHDEGITKLNLLMAVDRTIRFHADVGMRIQQAQSGQKSDYRKPPSRKARPLRKRKQGTTDESSVSTTAYVSPRRHRNRKTQQRQQEQQPAAPPRTQEELAREKEMMHEGMGHWLDWSDLVPPSDLLTVTTDDDISHLVTNDISSSQIRSNGSSISSSSGSSSLPLMRFDRNSCAFDSALLLLYVSGVGAHTDVSANSNPSVVRSVLDRMRGSTAESVDVEHIARVFTTQRDAFRMSMLQLWNDTLAPRNSANENSAANPELDLVPRDSSAIPGARSHVHVGDPFNSQQVWSCVMADLYPSQFASRSVTLSYQVLGDEQPGSGPLSQEPPTSANDMPELLMLEFITAYDAQIEDASVFNSSHVPLVREVGGVSYVAAGAILRNGGHYRCVAFVYDDTQVRATHATHLRRGVYTFDPLGQICRSVQLPEDVRDVSAADFLPAWLSEIKNEEYQTQSLWYVQADRVQTVPAEESAPSEESLQTVPFDESSLLSIEPQGRHHVWLWREPGQQPLRATIVDVGADGNCLFRCVSVVTTDAEDAHARARERITQYAVQHVDEFVDLYCEQVRSSIERDGCDGIGSLALANADAPVQCLEGDLPRSQRGGTAGAALHRRRRKERRQVALAMIEQRRRDGVWGSFLEIQIAARVFNVTFDVYTELPSQHNRPHRVGVVDDDTPVPLHHLCHVNGNHYVVAVPESRMFASPRPRDRVIVDLTSPPSSPAAAGTGKRPYVCGVCGESGHNKRRCPSARTDAASLPSAADLSHGYSEADMRRDEVEFEQYLARQLQEQRRQQLSGQECEPKGTPVCELAPERSPPLTRLAAKLRAIQHDELQDRKR
jgi:hypothetical protein